MGTECAEGSEYPTTGPSPLKLDLCRCCATPAPRQNRVNRVGLPLMSLADAGLRAGEWILARRTPAIDTDFIAFLDTLNSETNGGGGAFDFFELLGPGQPLALDGPCPD